MFVLKQLNFLASLDHRLAHLNWNSENDECETSGGKARRSEVMLTGVPTAH